MNHADAMLVGCYDYRLVLLSIFIAILASYVGLDLASRVKAATSRTRRMWMTGGAVSIGFGIWSTQYIGMLAFRLPVPVLYDVPIVFASLFAAIIGSAAGLLAVSHRSFGRVEAIIGSLAMGAGIVSIHYIGMAAMRLTAACHYNPAFVGLSILIAIVASLAAILFASDFCDETRTTWAKIGSGAVVGFGIASMHYTGMAAASFTPSGAKVYSSHAINVSQLVLIGIVTITLIILGFTLLTTLMGRRLDAQAAKLALMETRYHLRFEHSLAGHYRATIEGRVLEGNEAFVRIFGYTSLSEGLAHQLTEYYQSPNDWQTFTRELREKSTVANREVQLQAHSGQPVWVRENATLIEQKNGVPIIEGSLIDITQRKQSEKELARAHEELRRTHEELEARVCERTAALAKINDALRAEVAGNTRDIEEIARLRSQIEQERDHLREAVKESHAFGGMGMVGKSTALQRVLSQIDLVAPTDAPVLIIGETGTGKERVALAIHELSPRSAHPIVKVNCSSIPRELFESEFFGHVKGAFTGALRDRAGRFELADRGTLFLDEVSEIPLQLQSKLLRVLQEGELERVGDESTRRVNVRVIAATNRDLQREVQAGRFRLDLFHRLAVFPLQVPPLRDRLEDIPVLTAHFIEMICSRSNLPRPHLRQCDIEILQQHDWPGNVRELQNVIDRAVILARGGRLQFNLPAPSGVQEPHPGEGPQSQVQKQPILTEEEMRAQERENLRRALDQTGGRISGPSGAAELLGIHPNTLAYRLKKLGISYKT